MQNQNINTCLKKFDRSITLTPTGPLVYCHTRQCPRLRAWGKPCCLLPAPPPLSPSAQSKGHVEALQQALAQRGVRHQRLLEGPSASGPAVREALQELQGGLGAGEALLVWFVGESAWMQGVDRRQWVLPVAGSVADGAPADQGLAWGDFQGCLEAVKVCARAGP